MRVFDLKLGIGLDVELRQKIPKAVHVVDAMNGIQLLYARQVQRKISFYETRALPIARRAVDSHRVGFSTDHRSQCPFQ